MNDKKKMAQAMAMPIKISGGYCEIRNPVRSAIARIKIRRIYVRTATRLNKEEKIII